MPPRRNNKQPLSKIQRERCEKLWDAKYRELKEYYRKHGNYDGLTESKTRNTPLESLFKWMGRQRIRRSPNTRRSTSRVLTQREIDLLDKIRFDWRPCEKWDDNWEKMFLKLKKHKLVHGSFSISTAGKDNRRLLKWTYNQRESYKNGLLLSERQAKLEGIGFEWRLREPCALSHARAPSRNEQWRHMYDRLLSFREEFGHCLVPRLYEHDEALSNWVNTQRVRARRIPKYRKKLLDDIGFVWKVDYSDASKSLHQKHWEKMFEKLRAYRKRRGHCRVPIMFEDQELANWVQCQRRRFRSGHLLSNRKEKLDSIEFDWCMYNMHAGIEAQSESEDNLSFVECDDDNVSETSSQQRPAIDDVQVGSRLSVYWPLEHRYYDGVVDRKKKTGGDEVHVIYTDGDKGWVDLEKDEVKLIDGPAPDSVLSKRRKRKVPDVAVGSRISVYWSSEGQYYDGAVNSISKNQNKAFVLYDDGDEGWVNLETGEAELDDVACDDDDGDDGIPESATKRQKIEEVTIGSMITVYWPSEDQWYSGTVTRLNEAKKNEAFVLYSDGDKGWVNLDTDDWEFNGEDEDIVPESVPSGKRKHIADITAGTKISVYWSLEGQWYNGKVIRINKKNENEACILYDDGERGWVNLDTDDIKLRGDDETADDTTSPKAKKRRVRHNDNGSTASSSSENGEAAGICVGAKVSVGYCGRYRDATVRKIDRKSKPKTPHFLVYDGKNVQEWTDLGKRKHFLVSSSI